MTRARQTAFIGPSADCLRSGEDQHLRCTSTPGEKWEQAVNLRRTYRFARPVSALDCALGDLPATTGALVRPHGELIGG